MSIETTKQMNDQSYTYINLDYMDMMSDGDDSMKMVMLEMLLDELPQEMQKMNELCTAADWSELGSVSHKMKSTLAFVGNDSMTQANTQVETICKSGENVESLAGLMIELTALAPKALEELKAELGKL